MEIITCLKHMTTQQKDRVDHRTVNEKRQWLNVGDAVVATSEYRRLFSTVNPEFEGGKIIGFKDPWEWGKKIEKSVAYIEMLCGCVKFINTGWLKRK